MNSSLQVNNVDINTTKKCIHTKQVYSLLDTPKKEEAYKKLSKHMEICRACSEEFQKFQVKTIASQVYIPKALMDHDLRQSFEREVGELFKVMNLNDREMLQKKVKNGFLFLDRMGIDFLKNIVSKSMLKTYLLAFVFFFCLKLIF